MLRTLRVIGLIVMSLLNQGDALADADQSGGTGGASEFAEIENRLAKAWIDGDRQTVDSILASDWSVIDMTGHVLTKAQVMKEFGSGDRRIESGSIDEVAVRRFGDIAVVTGRSMLSGTYKGNRVSVVQRFTDIFAKRDGRWQAVASQGTQVAQQPTEK
ncbi:MAG: nuclear transport factor 2 family protein [Blastocatellia bacterium]